jgi:RNA polymerase sigma-70 factor, ECF subfamily
MVTWERNQLDESTLFKAARKLDQGALITIFDIYALAVYRYCFRLCRDPVESDIVVGDVFARFLENLSADRNLAKKLRTCIFQITYQTIVDSMGTSRQEIVVDRQLRTDHGQSLTGKVSEPQGPHPAQILLFLAADLNAVQRHILLLRYLEEFSLNETAFIVGKSVGNVKVIQNRVMTKLRSLLGLMVTDRPQSFASNLDA